MKRITLIGLLLFSVNSFAGPDPRGVLELESYSTGDSSGIKSSKGRGDFNEKEAVRDGDKLFFLKGYGYISGSLFSTTPAASANVQAQGDWISTKNGAYWSFSGTPTDSTTEQEVLRIGDFDSGLFVSHETFTNLIAVDTNTVLTDINVSTGSLGGLTTSYTTVDFVAQPDFPRALSWTYTFVTGSATGTITFTGVNANGDSVSEDATLNYAACNKNNITSNAFATLSTVGISYSTHTSDSNSELFFVGVSSAIGLANDISFSTNTFKVTENGANVASGYTISPTYDTYLPATAPSGTADYDIWYRATKSPL